MKNKLVILYLLVLAIEIWADSNNQKIVMMVTKPLLMPLLVVLYLSFKQTILPNWYYIIALIFSLFGDVFLMFKSKDLFIPGLASFLIAHIFYIVLFIKESKILRWPTLIILIITISYLFFLKPNIENELILPVSIYCIVISFMGIVAINRKKSSFGYSLISFGALLFIISDSLIAFNKFVENLPQSSFLIMITYGLAQLFILFGFLKKK
jgi:uncharacterized membrane protein YhhN